jgi:hypothetical protein
MNVSSDMFAALCLFVLLFVRSFVRSFVCCKEYIISVVVKHLNSLQRTFRAGLKAASKIWRGLCTRFELFKNHFFRKGKTDLINLKAGRTLKTEVSFAFIWHNLTVSEVRIRYAI